MRRLLAILCGLGLVLPACAVAAGGPISPQQGGVGASAPGGGVTYIALGAGQRTVIESVRRAGGAVERFTSLRGSFGIPGVASDGSATGLSADGRTLVVSGGVGHRGRAVRTAEAGHGGRFHVTVPTKGRVATTSRDGCCSRARRTAAQLSCFWVAGRPRARTADAK
jgi:hypothetical protein